MNVNFFLNIYKTKVKQDSTDEDKVKIISNILRIKNYINFKDKVYMIEDLFSKYDLQHNSNERFYRFTLLMLEKYTDLDIDDDIFDSLSKYDLFKYIIHCFESEYETCVGIMNNYVEDMERK